jgi:hypothetical protein
MQQILWFVDVARANQIGHYKMPDVSHGYSPSDDIRKRVSYLLDYSPTRVRIKATSHAMMLAVLKVVVKHERFKSVMLEDDHVNINPRPGAEDLATLESAIRILLAAKHLKMVSFKIYQHVVIRDAQMLHDAVMQSRATHIDFDFCLGNLHIPFIFLAAKTHPTLKKMDCHFGGSFFSPNYFEREMNMSLTTEIIWPFGRPAGAVIEWQFGPKHKMWQAYQDNRSYLIYGMSRARVDSKLAMIRSPHCQNIKFQGCDFSGSGVPDLSKFENIKRVYIIGCMLGDIESGDAAGEKKGERAEKKRKKKAIKN